MFFIPKHILYVSILLCSLPIYAMEKKGISTAMSPKDYLRHDQMRCRISIYREPVYIQEPDLDTLLQQLSDLKIKERARNTEIASIKILLQCKLQQLSLDRTTIEKIIDNKRKTMLLSKNNNDEMAIRKQYCALQTESAKLKAEVKKIEMRYAKKVEASKQAAAASSSHTS